MFMKFLISYFYQVRFFENYMIPFSTAKWDPKWFTFHYDKNNVINGLRINALSPKNDNCHGRKECKFSPDSCIFLKEYEKQLNKLNFDELIKYCEDIGNKIKQEEDFSHEPIIILLVYETPDNPCSERVILKKWFNEHGYELEEFKKGESYE